jgi:hypothetical protein
MNQRILKIIGASLIMVALCAFFTVADDLHHFGEFFTVAGILCSGVTLFAAGRFPELIRHFALVWVSVGIGSGMVVGAITDRVAIAVCGGMACGILLARFFRRPVFPSDAAA